MRNRTISCVASETYEDLKNQIPNFKYQEPNIKFQVPKPKSQEKNTKKIKNQMEKINTKELFEKYRHLMNNEKKVCMTAWNQKSSVEEYIKTEGYGHGVVLFLTYIEGITDGEFVDYDKKWDVPDEDTFDSKYDEAIFKRKDGKLFKCDICVEFGKYSEEMIEVKEKTKTIKLKCYE